MKKLIEHYPVSPASSEKFTKSSCIEHLCKEKGLLEALIEVNHRDQFKITFYRT